MATSEIASDIQNITGVGTADTGFIESAQRFVVSSVPKELLRWASSETVASSHGGDSSPTGITLPVGSDGILSVRRESYRASEVSVQDAAFLESGSGSLKIPTSTFPKYYIKSGNVVNVKPDPTNSATAHVEYVDYSNINDASDLRNAVVYHSISKEYGRLASGKISDVVLSPSPVSPDAPSFTTPDVASVFLNNIGVPPTYTAPAITTGDSPGDDATKNLSTMDTTAWTDLDYDFDDENINALKWFQVAGDFIQNQEDFELAGAQLQKINSYAGVYAQGLQNQLNKFNDDNTEYQAKLQEAVRQADINATEAQQEANLKLQKETQEYSSKLQLLQAEVSRYQNEINAQIQNVTSLLQNASFYSAESKKYYEWAVAEVSLYIKNNSKMINKTLAAQAASGR